MLRLRPQNTTATSGFAVLHPSFGHQLEKGLVGCWLVKGMACGGGAALDHSRYRNIGYATGFSASPLCTSGHHGGASIDFQRTSVQYFTIGDLMPIKITSAITITVWVKPNAVTNGAFPRVISKLGGSPYNGYELNLNDGPNTHKPYLQVGTGGTLKLAQANTAVASGTWSFLAATYDGSTGQFYFNGVAEGTTFSAASAIGDTTTNLMIGAWPGGPPSNGNSMEGAIENCRIYNRALSAAEIYWLYTEPYAGLIPAYFAKISGQSAAAAAALPQSLIVKQAINRAANF